MLQKAFIVATFKSYLKQKATDFYFFIKKRKCKKFGNFVYFTFDHQKLKKCKSLLILKVLLE